MLDVQRGYGYIILSAAQHTPFFHSDWSVDQSNFKWGHSEWTGEIQHQSAKVPTIPLS